MAQEEVAQHKCLFCESPMTAQAFQAALKRWNNERDAELSAEKKKHEEDKQSALDEQRKNMDTLHRDDQESLTTHLRKMHDDQITILKETNENRYKEELESKDKEITGLKDERTRFKQLGFDEATLQAKEEIAARDLTIQSQQITINRTKKDLEESKQQLAQSQPNVKGLAGEFNLIALLKENFPDDKFVQQTPGTAEADVVHTINHNGKFLEKELCYDNKEAKHVGKTDRDKAKNYEKVHNTNHVYIVTRNIPKEVENRLVGQVDGVQHVHPSIFIDVVKLIRKHIIESTVDELSQKDRDSKEAKLYDYIASQEFSRHVKVVQDVSGKMYALQIQEETGHKKLWKIRKALQENLTDAYEEITSSVSSITQEPSAKKLKQSIDAMMTRSFVILIAVSLFSRSSFFWCGPLCPSL